MPAERAKLKLARLEAILACPAGHAVQIRTNVGNVANRCPGRTNRREVQKMRNSHDDGAKGSLNRRSFLGVTGAVAVATIAGGPSASLAADRTTQVHVSGRRRLGSLERWARSAEHEPQVRNDRAVPPGNDQHHPPLMRTPALRLATSAAWNRASRQRI